MTTSPGRFRRLPSILLLSGLSAWLPAWSQSPAVPSAVPYVLGRDATFQQGCFDPCDCPLLEEMSLHGTFQLTPLGSDPLFTNYAVGRIRWVVPQMGGMLITGEGTYRIGGEFALEERLVLDLSVNGGPPQRFDSGRDIGPSPFPSFDIQVSLNGGVCFDTVLTVRARPALQIDADPARLSWSPALTGDRFDLLAGDLRGLAGGDLAGSALVCLANDLLLESLDTAGTPDPPVGSGYWYLVRADLPDGSWDSASEAQAGARDPVLASSAAVCP